MFTDSPISKVLQVMCLGIVAVLEERHAGAAVSQIKSYRPQPSPTCMQRLSPLKLLGRDGLTEG